MKRMISAIAFLATMIWGAAAFAQATYWVQLEANTTLREAEDSARNYAEGIDNVVGFRLGQSGWYATALGPFTEAAATTTLLDLLRRGAVPRDSYVTDGRAYGQQFYPVGANDLTQAPVEVEETPAQEPAADPAITEEVVEEAIDETVEEVVEAPAEPEPAPAPEPEPEETRQQALQSERLLNRPEREQLQIALQFFGFYNSGIDGAFGPGTRNSMRLWQEDKGYEATGVLTTRQRTEILADYQGVIDSLGLASVTDQDAGIELIMPTAMVEFDRYEAPFAHYEGEDGVRVVLISQSGGQSTLYGLYDILQSLEVVPAEGERQRRSNDFTINGSNSEIKSYTYATVVDGAVKGFMLVWPQGDDVRYDMALSAMRDGFRSMGATVLDDNAGLDQAMQSVDLVSGLEIRRADVARTGFYVSDAGAVLTTLEAVQGCGQITLDESYPAQVTAQDADLGLALLMPEDALAPLDVATLATGEARINSDLAVAGFSFGGRLSSATLTFGSLADVRGLEGEDNVYRLDLNAQDGDAGGPIIDKSGVVLGMLQSDGTDASRQFPDEVSFAAKAAALTDFLSSNGVTPKAADSGDDLLPHALAMKAADMSVLVSCWK